MDEDDDLAAALALSKAEDPQVASRAGDFLSLPKSVRESSLPVVMKLLGNLTSDPSNEKFRSIRLTNPKIKATIADVPAAKALLLACGFSEAGESLVAGEGAEAKGREALALLEEATAGYGLSVEFTGHAGAVRCVCALPDGGVATGAMDNVVRLFPGAGGPARCLVGHACTSGVDGVLALCTFSSDARPRLASGARDGRILVWDLASGAQGGELTGHGEGAEVTNAKSISALAALTDGTLVSGGWDKTMRIWSATPQVLTGHQVAVNAVCVLASGEIVSASGDGTLRLWRQGTAGLCDAQSPARGVCAVGGGGVAFASAHNDGSVRTWASGGAAVKRATASGSYCFSVAYDAGREQLATGGDDGVVKLWSLSLDELQTIQHPMEVFAVAFTAGGDLLTACGDETARLWSKDPRRRIADATLRDFEGKVAAGAAAQAAAGGGSVASGAPAAGAGAGAGGAWDYEFPVELTGGKKMTLRWNRGESTQDVANRFLQENSLGANHAPDVMAFVAQAQAQAAAGAGAGGAGGGGGGGQTYSYPVEVADGRRLNISWTRGEDPTAVAQRFATQHMIPAAELQDIANFVAQVQGGPAPAPAAQAPAPAPVAVTPEAIAMLTSMGFDAASAQAALQAAGGDVELAISRLVG